MNLWKYNFQISLWLSKKGQYTKSTTKNDKKLENTNNKIGVHTMDLSQTFGTLNHKLLVANLKAYGLDSNTASFIKSYLANRYQRCKIEDSFSEWERIKLNYHKVLFLDPYFSTSP